jgi:hypothetical protein
VHAGPLGPALIAMLARDPKLRPDAEQFDRLLAMAEHATPPTPPTAWSPMAASLSNPGLPQPSTGSSGWLLPGSQPAIPQPPVRRRRAPLIAIAAAVLVVAGVLVWTLLPGVTSTTGTGGTPTPLGAAGPPTGTASSHPTTTAAPTTQAPQDQLTPAGVRSTIAAMSQTMGTKVIRLVIYPDHATAEAPTAADPKLYDDFNYRGGMTTHSPGGEVNTTTDAPIDLGSINWDILPTLLRKAQDTLNVPNPTVVYLIVESDLQITDAGTTLRPVIRVFRADNYGGGMLMTDLKGNVISTVPRA